MNLNVSEVVFYCLVVPIGIIHTTVAAAAFHFAMKCHCFQGEEGMMRLCDRIALFVSVYAEGQWFMFMLLLLNCFHL